MQLSETLLDQLDKAIEIHNAIAAATGKKLNHHQELRSLLTVALCSLAIEHYGSIIELLGTGQNTGSAFALLRPLVETTFRAFWLNLCVADDDVLPVASRRRDFPPLAKLTAEVGNLPAVPHASTPFTLDNAYRNMMHGLTHSGMEALDLRISKDWVVGGPYPEDQVRQLIREATRFGMYAATFYLNVTEQNHEAHALIQLFNDRFGTDAPHSSN